MKFMELLFTQDLVNLNCKHDQMSKIKGKTYAICV